MQGPVRVFTIFLGAFGAIGAISPLAFVAWSGALNEIATWLELPIALTIGVSVTSALVLVVLMWEAGRRLQPAVSTVILPVLAGTIARAAVIAPAPAGLYVTLALGSVYLVVAIAGALWQRRRGSPSGAEPPARLRLAFSAMTLPVLLALVVRWMAMGVRFGG